MRTWYWLLALPAAAATAESASPTAADEQCSQKTISDAYISFRDVDEIHDRLYTTVQHLTHELDYFRYYRLNLYAGECAWGDDDAMCGNIACAVDTLDERDVPEIWQTRNLSRIEGPRVEVDPAAVSTGYASMMDRIRAIARQLGQSTTSSCLLDHEPLASENIDYCRPDDDSSEHDMVYVSLLSNPERYTGYAGPHARRVWNAIYRENCFESVASCADGSCNGHHAPVNNAARSELQSVMDPFRLPGRMSEEEYQEHERLDMLQGEQQCLEQRVFYRILSGMHASISTHLCHNYLNKSTGEWGPNEACFEQRVGKHRDRIENIYFNYVLVLRAIAKLQSYVDEYTFCGESADQDYVTRQQMQGLVQLAAQQPQSFDESLLFNPDDSASAGLKAEFRAHFRNVSALMDCVGCDKCRLWGKIQTNGLGTALKILFEYHPSVSVQRFSLSRAEMVALVNTFDRLSMALAYIRDFASIRHDAAAQTRPDGWSALAQRHLPRPLGHVLRALSDALRPVTDQLAQEVDEIMVALRIVLASWASAPSIVWWSLVRRDSPIGLGSLWSRILP